MGTEKERFKDEFRQRVYRFALDIIKFVEQLPKEQTSKIMDLHKIVWVTLITILTI